MNLRMNLFLLLFGSVCLSLEAQQSDIKDFQKTPAYQSLCKKMVDARTTDYYYALYSEMAFYSRLNQTDMAVYIKKRAAFRNQLNALIGDARSQGQTDAQIDEIVINTIDGSELEPFDQYLEKRAMKGEYDAHNSQDVQLVQELNKYAKAPDSKESFVELFKACK